MTRTFVDVINCIHESPRYLRPNYTIMKFIRFS